MQYVCYLNARKSNAKMMLEAFVQGARAAGHNATIVQVNDRTRLTPGTTAVFYGVDQVTLALFEEAQLRGAQFAYIDNGYFGSKWKGGDYYRITRQSMQHNGTSPSDGNRWGELRISVKPMRAIDGDILLALQSDFWYTRFGTTKRAFHADVQRAIGPHMGKYKLLVRDKTEHASPIDWENTRAVIAHSSNVAVDGILEGVPCFVTYPCAALTLAGKYPMVDLLHCPPETEVLPWCWSLADNQWAVEEIAEGLPFKVL